MALATARADLGAVLGRALRPPVRDARFWFVQALVVAIAGIHFGVDLQAPSPLGTFPDGLPVAVLVLPVGYAAMRFGLAGSAATGLWATALWLPDLLLPHDQGHVGADILNLVIVDVIAFVFGERIEAERFAHARAEATTAEALAVEARYRRLFETNRSPILVLDRASTVRDANPAALELFGADLVGLDALSLFPGALSEAVTAGVVVTLRDGGDYRVDHVPLASAGGETLVQVTLEDVTRERREGRRATRYAQLVVQAEEDQRLRLSRELHDEPLQLFLHLARRLEGLAEDPGVPDDVAVGLEEARLHALDAAGRLRALARDLRPPALDRLGLVAALSSLVADVEDEAGVVAQLRVDGREVRLTSDEELGAFRIVQEAVRNALRHGRPTRVTVHVGFAGAQLSLHVEDDGCGFDPGANEQPGSTHLGLLGMRERARLLDGALEVRSSPGTGTIVEAVLPLRVAQLVEPATGAGSTPSVPDGAA